MRPNNNTKQYTCDLSFTSFSFESSKLSSIAPSSQTQYIQRSIEILKPITLVRMWSICVYFIREAECLPNSWTYAVDALCAAMVKQRSSVIKNIPSHANTNIHNSPAKEWIKITITRPPHTVLVAAVLCYEHCQPYPTLTPIFRGKSSEFTEKIHRSKVKKINPKVYKYIGIYLCVQHENSFTAHWKFVLVVVVVVAWEKRASGDSVIHPPHTMRSPSQSHYA